MKIRNDWKLVIGAFFILMVMMLASEDSITIMEDTNDTYCNNVRDGVWPDYKGVFKTQCGEI